MMGIEAVKSSTPAPCRLLIKNALKLMMNGTEEDVIDFIDESQKTIQKITTRRDCISPHCIKRSKV